mmetsp:Transcript_74214/g.241362  ORF Transcript_74214/g.241362 Transcript_74214/m.241362 type:complete len:606 (-) Transcript_74214:13-1830(-)
MAGESSQVFDTVLIVLFVGLLATNAVLAMWWRPCSKFQRYFSMLCKDICSTGQEDDDEEDKCIRNLVDKRLTEAKVKFAMHLAKLGCCMSVGAGCVFTFDLATVLMHDTPRRRTQSQALCQMLLFALFTTFSFGPPRLLAAMRLKFFLLVTILLQLGNSPWTGSTKVLIVSRDAWDSIVGMGVAVGTLDIRLSAILLIGSAVFKIFGFAFAEGEIEGIGLSEFVLLKASATIAMLAIAYGMILYSSDSARLDIEKKVENNQRHAFVSLLNLMCDVVVELGPDLRIVEHVQTLAHVLLQGAGISLQGMELRQFMPDPDDQEVFVRSVTARSAPSVSNPASFVVTLRDAIGNRITFQVYHISYLTPGGRRHHLISLTEQFGHRASSRGAESHVDGAGKQDDSFDRPVDSQSGITALGFEPPTSPTLPRSLESQGDDLNDEDDLQVDFVLSPSLSITWSSPQFQNQYGACCDFVAYLRDPTDFQKWLASRIKDVFKGTRGTQGVFLEEYGYLHIGPRQDATGSDSPVSWNGDLRRVSVLFPEVRAETVAEAKGRIPHDWMVGYRVSAKIGQTLSVGIPHSRSATEDQGPEPLASQPRHSGSATNWCAL